MISSTVGCRPTARKDTLLSRREIEGLIAEGRTIIILDGRVVKADAWLKYHPGGDKAIMHMVGRDATDEVNAYVNGPFVFYALWLIVGFGKPTLSRCSLQDGLICDRQNSRPVGQLPTAHTRWIIQASRQRGNQIRGGGIRLGSF